MNDITKAVAEVIEDQQGCGVLKGEAEAFIAALKERGISLTWTEPTTQMLETVGVMGGWDGVEGQADENHIDWYKAMISAADKE